MIYHWCQQLGENKHDREAVMRKNANPQLSDIRRIKSTGNVFVDLGFKPAEAKEMARRARIVIRQAQRKKLR